MTALRLQMSRSLASRGGMRNGRTAASWIRDHAGRALALALERGLTQQQRPPGDGGGLGVGWPGVG